jgi:hypothetical protein
MICIFYKRYAIYNVEVHQAIESTVLAPFIPIFGAFFINSGRLVSKLHTPKLPIHLKEAKQIKVVGIPEATNRL